VCIQARNQVRRYLAGSLIRKKFRPVELGAENDDRGFVTLPLRRIRQLLLVGFAGISALGLAVELLHHSPYGAEFEGIVAILSLSEEANVPTWYSSCLLFACAAALALVARAQSLSGARHRRRWWVLSAAFLLVSADEIVGLHERSNALFDFGGVLSFGWVVLGAAATALLGIVCAPVLSDLPRSIRRRFIAAGILYVFGALVMELPLGYWMARTGSGDLTYALIDCVEESLEILGATVLLDALLEHLGARHGALRVVGTPNGS